MKKFLIWIMQMVGYFKMKKEEIWRVYALFYKNKYTYIFIITANIF